MSMLEWFVVSVFAMVLVLATGFVIGILIFVGRALDDDTHHQGSMDEHR